MEAALGADWCVQVCVCAGCTQCALLSHINATLGDCSASCHSAVADERHGAAVTQTHTPLNVVVDAPIRLQSDSGTASRRICSDSYWLCIFICVWMWKQICIWLSSMQVSEESHLCVCVQTRKKTPSKLESNTLLSLAHFIFAVYHNIHSLLNLVAAKATTMRQLWRNMQSSHIHLAIDMIHHISFTHSGILELHT